SPCLAKPDFFATFSQWERSLPVFSLRLAPMVATISGSIGILVPPQSRLRTGILYRGRRAGDMSAAVSDTLRHNDLRSNWAVFRAPAERSAGASPCQRPGCRPGCAPAAVAGQARQVPDLSRERGWGIRGRERAVFARWGW